MTSTFRKGSIHTYPDIFENGGFSSRFRENPRSHVAFSNRFCLSTTFDVIVFENLRFPLFTRLKKNTWLTKSTVWRPFSKSSRFGYQKHRLRMDGARIRVKKYPVYHVIVWTDAPNASKGLRFQTRTYQRGRCHENLPNYSEFVAPGQVTTRRVRPQ